MNKLFGNNRSDSIKKIKEERDDLYNIRVSLELDNEKLLDVIDKQKTLIIFLENKIKKQVEQELENKIEAYQSVKKSINKRYSTNLTLVIIDNILFETAVSMNLTSMDLLSFKEDKFSEGTSVVNVKTY